MIRQGDPRLLDNPVAQRLLHSTELARPAYMGQAELSVEPGVAEECELAHRRYYGSGQAELSIAPLCTAGVSMGRIVLRPNRVGLIDFQTRVPRPMAGALG